MARVLLYILMEERAMLDRTILKEIIGILMGSVFYLSLSVRERLDMVRHLMRFMS